MCVCASEEGDSREKLPRTLTARLRGSVISDAITGAQFPAGLMLLSGR